MSEHQDEGVLIEAKDLLANGKRYMALEDYQKATDLLEQAVQLFDAYYGVAKIQSADAYLEYGLALVALANLEAGSGTDKIMKRAGIEEEEEGEDEDENEDEGGEADGDVEGDGEQEEEDDQGEETEGTEAKEEVKEVPKAKENGTSVEPTPGTSSGATNGDDKSDKEEEDEEATTIEIAWEVLCLAKRLFMTDESLEGRLKLAETLQKLGEISIEWDNNDNAVSILEECLNIRTAVLPSDDRLIALTYYHLGLAHSFKSETQNANDNFQKAINVIEKRIEAITKKLEAAKASQDTASVSALEKEINELKELLPDINMRMDDSKEDASDNSEVLKRNREELKQEDEEVKKVCLDNSKPVDNISHLVKRKAA